jgi:hypothetical protein
MDPEKSATADYLPGGQMIECPSQRTCLRAAPTLAVRQVTRLNPYAHSHGQAVGILRFGIGLWLLGLGAYLCYRGSWWGALFIAPAALHFYLGRRAVLQR